MKATPGPRGALAQQLGLPRAAVQRELNMLAALGYVQRDDEGDEGGERYRLAMRLFELGVSALESVDLVREADLEMRRIAAATRETVHLGALDEDAIVYIHKLDADYGLGVQSRVGRRNPLHSTAIGKVLLAWMPDDELNETLARIDFKRSTPRTIALAQALREQGYGADDEEQEEGLRCLAAPVFDRFGNVAAALSISSRIGYRGEWPGPAGAR